MDLCWIIHNYQWLKITEKLPPKKVNGNADGEKSNSVFCPTQNTIYKSHSFQAGEEIIYFDSSYHECKAMEKLDIALEAPRGQNGKRSFFARCRNVISTGHFSLIMWQNKIFVSCLLGNPGPLHPVCASFSRESCEVR